jgi:hypothetical protein
MFHRRNNNNQTVVGTGTGTGIPGEYVQQPGFVNSKATTGGGLSNQGPGYGYDGTNVNAAQAQKPGYGGGNVNYAQTGQGEGYVGPGYVAPDGTVRRKRNRAANWCAGAFIACWACTWPCHGPCCCGL